MNKETLTALDGAIEKWGGVAEGKVQDKGADNCPLCELFFDYCCVGCPVMERTGKDGCRGTPYYKFTDLAPTGWARGKRAKAAARQEVEFLKSLMLFGLTHTDTSTMGVPGYSAPLPMEG